MEQQEWMEYVKKVTTCHYPVPAAMVQDYNDWRCRSIVGRMLYFLKDIEGAIAILTTVKDVEPNLEDVPKQGLSEAEHKVLCLRDIAEIVWSLTHTAYAPLIYLEEAYDLCRKYQHLFRSVDRGAILYRRLELLEADGQQLQAVALASSIIEKEGGVEAVNPYVFYSLGYLGQVAGKAGNYSKGAQLLAQAYKYYPLNDKAREDLAQAASIEEPQARYEAYVKCHGTKYNVWEYVPPAVIRRDEKGNLIH